MAHARSRFQILAGVRAGGSVAATRPGPATHGTTGGSVDLAVHPVEGMAWLARIEASQDAEAARRALAATRGPDASPGYPRHDRAEPRRSAKVGRNEPCPCGSGRKFKKCCGA